MRLAYDISMENRKLGISPVSFSEFISALYSRVFSKKNN